MKQIEPFPVYDVPFDAPQAFEAMGTKPKFWFKHEELGYCLFKKSRPGTGEDWAEKIAAELAGLLGLPHADYHLARSLGQRGTISPKFLPQNALLIHGNEFLFHIEPGYGSDPTVRKNFYRVSQHTLDLVFRVLEEYLDKPPVGYQLPKGIENGLEVFVGYILLDAWICNTDRHHENWALVLYFEGSPTELDSPTLLFLAPTFDHASSLGRELDDATRRNRLATADHNYTVDAYIDRSRSAFYDSIGDKRSMLTMEAYYRAAAKAPHAANAWKERLAAIAEDDLEHVIRRVPEEIMSEDSRSFCRKLLMATKARILDTRSATE